MYLIEAFPLTKLPNQNHQIFSYFSTRDLAVGSLILAPLAKRNEKAIVIESHALRGHKIEIKEAGYELRPIKKIISEDPILTLRQIELALWLGQYYFTSPGIFAKMMMPKKWQMVNDPLRRSFPLKARLAKGGSEASKWQMVSKSPMQKLILVPTISQVDSTAQNYPKEKTIIVHSGLKSKQLSENWQKIARGETQIIIGTRLAIFAPFVNLKEIIIEDETNSSHRSWDMHPHYRTHEAAKKLAEIFGAGLALKAPVPSIESYYFNGQKTLNLKVDSKENKNAPETELIDLRQELKDGNYSIFSRKLQNAIGDVLEKKQQIILFINRRGLATFVLCRDCGYVAKCSNCEAPLTYHLTKTKTGELKPLLICHHCGQKQDPPTLCPKCNGHRIKTFGTGTQRVEAEAKRIFKDVKILRLDSDVAQTFEQQNKIIEDFKQKKADILVGTQMILASPLPKVPLLALISADTLMHLPDFRSDERLFGTIDQLKNMSSAKFFIQTYNPKSAVLNFAVTNDWKEFFKQEIETRQVLHYPPFSQLIKLTFRHNDARKSATEAKILAAKLTQQLKISKIYKDVVLELSAAVPAFIPKEKGKYVWQIILKAKPYWLASKDERGNLLSLRNKFLLTVPFNWEIDIDPETLL